METHTLPLKLRRRSLGLIEIVLAMAVVAVLMYLLLRINVTQPNIEQRTKDALQEQNIDTSTYITTLESTRQKIKDVERQRAEQLESAETSEE